MCSSDLRLRELGGPPLFQQGLQVIGGWLPSQLRTSDMAFRYSEAGIIILLSETEAAGAVLLADRIRSRIGTVELKHKGQRVPLAISVGAAATDQIKDPATLSGQALVVLADETLRAAVRDQTRSLARPAEAPRRTP